MLRYKVSPEEAAFFLLFYVLKVKMTLIQKVPDQHFSPPASRLYFINSYYETRFTQGEPCLNFSCVLKITGRDFKSSLLGSHSRSMKAESGREEEGMEFILRTRERERELVPPAW